MSLPAVGRKKLRRVSSVRSQTSSRAQKAELMGTTSAKLYPSKRHCTMIEIVFAAFQRRAIAFAALCACAVITLAQEGIQKPASDRPNDVVRVTTELVQANATVFDKKGRFVAHLER